METKITRTDNGIKIEFEIDFKSSMLDTEEEIQRKLNEVGKESTGIALEQFDTDGSFIKIGSVKLTSKGKESKEYQTPYGAVVVNRHIYQTNQGGETYCPLEKNARIIHGTTPKFAKTVCHKYSDKNGRGVVEDLASNHGRYVSLGYVQNIVEIVAAIAEAKEDTWTYNVPKIEGVVTVSIGMDGAFIYILKEKYKQVMVGTISLYDKEQNRLYTKYCAVAPEDGKKTFKEQMEKEIKNVKAIYPKAKYIGLADGAKDNWDFLEKHTDIQTIDFYHVTEYLTKASNVIFTDDAEKKLWMDTRCHNLKHNKDYAVEVLNELTQIQNDKFEKKSNEVLESVITYFTNNHHRMNYAYNIKKNIPIGSGVTEAACKVIVKQRLCNSGMKWTRHGAGIVLKIRTMVYTTKQWDMFWRKINQYGLSL
jgi:hypothetical protein